MKKTLYIALALLSAAAGCTKYKITQPGEQAKGAQIKLIHVAPGLPAVDGYINGKKLSATTVYSVTDAEVPTSITTGFPYLSVFPGSNFLNVASGNTDIMFVAATPTPALKSRQTVSAATLVGELAQTTVDGGAYSAFLIGLPNATGSSTSVKVVEDKFPAPIASKAFIRFAHMIPNGTALDVYGTFTLTGGTATTKKLISADTYQTVTDFIPVDVNPASTTNYKLQLYLGGSTTTLGAITTDIPLAPGRYYTIIARGLAADYAVPGTSITLKAIDRPKLPTSDPNTRAPEIYYNAPGITYYTNK